MARVGIDCDGVLADFVSKAIEIANTLFPDYPVKKWSQWDSWGGQLTKSQEHKLWRKIDATNNFWLTLDAHISDVQDLAKWLHSTQGNDTWIITSRAETAGMSAAQQTKLWLDSCGLYSPLHQYLGIITVPYSSDKVDIISKLDIDWMIDDKVETIESMDRFPYLHAALLDRPWNQDAKVKWRVKSVGEFLEAVK